MGFQSADRPDVALISNHGYAGAEIPVGGAVDTGGQNVYVNALATTLDQLGYRVTIFTRGGFPHFNSQQIRREPEYLTDHVRYVFVPGGGDDFLRKEDIAIALDEQVEWLDRFIREEAVQRGCEPWEVYEFVNSHYWDAAILGVRLIERWRNDVSARVVAGLLEGVVGAECLERLRNERHMLALGETPVFYLGQLLLNCDCSPATPLQSRARAGAARWAAVRGVGNAGVDHLISAVEEALDEVEGKMAPALHATVAADALGVALLTLVPDTAERLMEELERVDRHVWTPHSLGELKDDNFRNRSLELRRDLKFCERRNHERMVCDRTGVFAATSAEIAEWLRTHYRVPVEQIFYFPPCVDPDFFRPYSHEETRATFRYLSQLSGVDEDRLRRGKIVFETSRMDRTKRKDLLLQAFAELTQDCRDAFLFIGGGPRNEVFESLAKQLAETPQLAGRAFLTGFIPDEFIGPLFSVAEIYASASEMEGFGMSVSQAAASKTALVASDLVPFCVYYVPEDAVIVHAGDVEDFAGALRRLLLDDNDRRKRAERLAEKVRVLDWKAQTGAFIEYLRHSGMEVQAGRN